MKKVKLERIIEKFYMISKASTVWGLPGCDCVMVAYLYTIQGEIK